MGTTVPSGNRRVKELLDLLSSVVTFIRRRKELQKPLTFSISTTLSSLEKFHMTNVDRPGGRKIGLFDEPSTREVLDSLVT